MKKHLLATILSIWFVIMFQNQAIATQIIGNIDGVGELNSVPHIVGWACAIGIPNAIQVRLSVGNTNLIEMPAKLVNEVGVQRACKTQDHHRFSIPLSRDWLSAYQGQPIIAHGVFGGTIGQLNNSGIFKIPPPQPVSSIIGNIDGIYQGGILGWACVLRQSAPIDVHLYAGGTILAATKANAPSELGVKQACQTGENHRFYIQLTPEQMSVYQGKPIRVYGISNAPDSAVKLLNNSDKFQVPEPSISILGNIDGVSQGIIFGWACVVGRSKSIDVHLYAGEDFSSPLIGITTNIPSEADVNNICQAGNKHRFFVPITDEWLQNHRGERIFMYGISGDPALPFAKLNQSGRFKLLKTIRIMPLGDSITHGTPSHYREELFDLLEERYDFEFVGSLCYVSPKQQAKEVDFDARHEGIGGFSTGQVLERRFNQALTLDPNRLFCSGSIPLHWPKLESSDVVLIHLGTNDLIRCWWDGQCDDMNKAIQQASSNLEEIIGRLRRDNSNVTILLAQIIPIYNNREKNNPVELLNKEIANLASKMNTAKSPVVLVDQYKGFDDIYFDDNDKLHPNKKGADEMANRWFQALKSSGALNH